MCAKTFRRHGKILLGVTAFVGLFSYVYERYAHGVRSNAMIFAFVYPLVLGVLPAFAFGALRVLRDVPYASAVRAGVNLYLSGVATLTMGSLAFGVVEIFGTTNRLLPMYDKVGWPLLAAGALVTVVGLALGVNRASAEKEA